MSAVRAFTCCSKGKFVTPAPAMLGHCVQIAVPGFVYKLPQSHMLSRKPDVCLFAHVVHNFLSQFLCVTMIQFNPSQLLDKGVEEAVVVFWCVLFLPTVELQDLAQGNVPFLNSNTTITTTTMSTITIS